MKIGAGIALEARPPVNVMDVDIPLLHSGHL